MLGLEDPDLPFRFPADLDEDRAADLELGADFLRVVFLEAVELDFDFRFAIFNCLLVCTGSNSVIRIAKPPQA